jgi:PPM family protein phosphatase
MIEFGSALDIGKKRSGSENQDAICIVRPSFTNWRPALLIVADGMGGYSGGAIASQQVVNTISSTYMRHPYNHPTLDALKQGVFAVMDALKQQAEQNHNLDKMGSTVVAAAIRGSKVSLINVGDSRAYLVSKKEMRQVSYDHSLVAELTRQGIITAEEAREHPRRNVLSMSLTAQRDQVEPFTTEFSWRKGDSLLLCSDGLWGPVTEEQIQDVICTCSPQQAADKLVELANNNHGPDNISVVIARYR